MTDALVPVVETPAVDAAAAAEATSGVVPAGSAALALPRVIVDAGPSAGETPRVLRGADPRTSTSTLGLVAYLPYWEFAPANATVVARGGADTATVLAAVAESVRGLDLLFPVGNERVLDDVLAESVAVRRFLLRVTAGFAVGGLVLRLPQRLRHGIPTRRPPPS